MASKNSKKRKRQPKSFRKKGLPGKRENAFYVDEKSKHPFVSQAKDGKTIYGHNVTHSPSLNPDGSIKSKYRRFPSNVRRGDSKPSYFDSTLERIDNTPKLGKETGRLKKKSWPVSKSNKRKLKESEKARMKKARQ